MKLLIKLEKSKTFWYLLCISLLFFFLRFPSLIEPNWYGDEGIYQVIGIALNHGRLLYSQIWDNKPPLLYLTYALFQGDQFGVRIASLFIGLLSVWLFFQLCQKLFEKVQTSVIASVLFALLFATPLLEGNIANAENFMLLPLIISALAVYIAATTKKTQKQYHFFLTPQHVLLNAAGFLLGIAFLFKIVALFDLAAFFCFLVILALPEKNKFTLATIKNLCSYLFIHLLLFIIGFIVPLLITISYFAANHALSDFIQATFFGNIGYVSYGNALIIPQGFLILKLLLLAGVVALLALKRAHFSKPLLFIVLWLAFSLFNAFFSQRPYTHYVLVLLPSFCLLFGLLINEKNFKIQQRLFVILFAVLFLVLSNFNLYGVYKTLFYYQNAILFIAGKKTVASYQSFFDPKTPRDYEVASFLKTHTHPTEQILLWGDSAQIYALSKTLPLTKYTVSYHITQSKNGIVQTQEALNTIKPKYVIILSEAPGFPFQLDTYTKGFSLNGAVMYEKTF
ncbi:MAG TPA: glycosyltransferase family 39 protein [Methylomirabilota bacterium]|nr:glycosyltransferase family 39 protein [Methylomirabilota bacterium]